MTGITILILLLSVAFIFIIRMYREDPETIGIERQKEDEKMASLFMEDLENGALETITETEVSYTDSELDYVDENYPTFGGIKYTPEFAKGHVACVLEIPAIKMRKSVYAGTQEEIQNDLDYWLTTQAHPYYVLGKTHYGIYGHNSTTQDLSFNRLKDVRIGDYFILTSPEYVYLYDVTDFFSDWRETVTRDIVDNFELPADKCYIITCGRNEYRYKDIVAVGTLRELYSLYEWDKVKDSITATRVENEKTVEDTREALKLSVSLSQGRVVVSVKKPDGTGVKGAKICITDEDGLFVKIGNETTRVTGENGTAMYEMSDFLEGTNYVAGLFENPDDSYRSANDVLFGITTKTISEGKIETEEVTVEKLPSDHHRTIQLVLLAITGALILACVILDITIIFGGRKRHAAGKS